MILDHSKIGALVGQGEAAGMAQYVRPDAPTPGSPTEHLLISGVVHSEAKFRHPPTLERCIDRL
jgi:hypothetical protein